MRKKSIFTLSLGLALGLIAGVAHAAFTPKFDVNLSNTKIKGNPALDFHLEFDADDEEIGNFKAYLPKGFNVAPDAAFPNDTVIGGGNVIIQAGPACANPSVPKPVSAPVTLDAEFLDKDRTDAQKDAGVHAVWYLDLEPLNRVPLLVTGSSKKGWVIEGAPTPSPNTCNPLTVDLTINTKGANGVAVVTNPTKKGNYTIKAEIFSQDSPSIATFKKVFKITK